MSDKEQHASSSATSQSASATGDATAESSLPPAYDPIKEGAKIIAPENFQALEYRLKSDIFNSLCRIKPDLRAHDFDTEIMQGTLIPTLSAPLQGIAIARVEGALSFYNRVGWHPRFLDDPLEAVVDDPSAATTLQQRYHARTLHDLAYVHPKHFEKIFGKTGAPRLWERLKQHSNSLQTQPD